MGRLGTSMTYALIKSKYCYPCFHCGKLTHMQHEHLPEACCATMDLPAYNCCSPECLASVLFDEQLLGKQPEEPQNEDPNMGHPNISD